MDITKASNGSMILPGSGNGAGNNASDNSIMDPSNSDHVVAVTQLREQITVLQRQLSKKDQEMINKDRQVRSHVC